MPKPGYLYQAAIVVLLLAAGAVVVMSARSSSPESDLAAPGAALYEFAVKESVISLMSKQEQAEHEVANRPPSPGPDYYWCENCKAYHKRETPASPQQPAVARTPGAAPAAAPQSSDAAAARPPSPGPDFYWCEQCKTYHKRQPQASAQQPAVARTPGAAPAAAPQSGDAAAARRPSPGPDFYWCEQCKTYHRKPDPASAQQPGAALGVPHIHTAPPAAAGTASSPGADYYYCEQCKTYHRRQPAVQQPVSNLNPLFGGVSNSPNRNPLIVP